MTTEGPAERRRAPYVKPVAGEEQRSRASDAAPREDAPSPVAAALDAQPRTVSPAVLFRTAAAYSGSKKKPTPARGAA